MKITITADEVECLVARHLREKGFNPPPGSLYADVIDGCFHGYSVHVEAYQLTTLVSDNESKPKWQRLADDREKGLIPAIKELRFQTNCGLKEAKDTVDLYRNKIS
jgi:hypothetical protein